MIKIVPDKEGRLTQWDLNRKIIVTGYEGVAEVHFASPGDDHGAYVVELIDGQAEIPNILLTMAGTINVYVYPADRTVFATTLWVMAREKPDDYVYTETEVLSYKTLDEKIGDLAELTTTARENLVAAINEAATKGMASIYMRVAEGYIEYSGDGVSWKQLIAVAELKGGKGDKGDPGSDATVDIVTPTAESTDTQAASAKAVWDMLGSSGSGTDISLGVTGAAVGDIIKVKAVDDSGKPTAWEAAVKTEDDNMPLLYHQIVADTITDFTLDAIDGVAFSLSAVKISAILKAVGTTWAGIKVWIDAVSPNNDLLGADTGGVYTVNNKWYAGFAEAEFNNQVLENRACDFKEFTPYINTPTRYAGSVIKSVPMFTYNNPPMIMTTPNAKINKIQIYGTFSNLEVMIWGQ